MCERVSGAREFECERELQVTVPSKRGAIRNRWGLLLVVFAAGVIVSVATTPLAIDARWRPLLDAALVASISATTIWRDITFLLRETADAEATKFRSLLDAAPEGVIGVGQDGRILFANSESQRLFQYSEPDLMGRSIEILIPERIAEQHVRSRTGYLTNPHRRTMGSGLEVTARRKDGSEFKADVSLSHIRMPKGTLVISIIRDVTTQRQMRDDLLEANRKLQAGLAQNMRRIEELRQLTEMAEDLQSCRSEQELFAVVARCMAGLFPSYSGALYLIPGDSTEAAATWGSARVETGDSTVSVPMLARGEAIGVLHLYGKPRTDQSDKIDEPHFEIAQAIADQVGLSIANVRLREALRLQSVCDPLTELYNRRFMDEWLSRELPRGARNGKSTSLMIMDLDHFKRFNDTYGHECGDLVLQEVSDLVRGSVRRSDIACRIGGEELVLLLPETGLSDALAIAEKLRLGIENLVVTYRQAPVDHITVSIGVAESPRHAASASALLRAADSALYCAKAAGRNRVVAAVPDNEPLLAE